MKKSQFVVLFLSVVNVMIGYGIIIPFISLYQNYFGVTILMTGLLISFYALGQFLFAPIAGDFINRFGERKVLAISQVLFAVCTVLVFSIHIFGVMLLFRFLSGMCAAGIYSTSENYIAVNASESTKTRYLMILNAGSGMGMILGPLIGVFIVEFLAITYSFTDAQTLDVAAIFIGSYAVYVIFVAALVFFTLPKNFVKHASVKSVKLLTFFPELIKQILSMCTNMKMVFILSGFFIYGYITSSVESFFLDYLIKNYTMDRFILGIEIVLIAIFVVVFFVKIAPFIESKFQKISLLAVYLMVPSIMFIILSFTPSLGVFFPAFVVIMISAAMFTSLLVSFVSEEQAAPGLILGVKNSVISIGMILGPIISGYFYQQSSANFMLQISIALIVIAIFAVVIRQKYYRGRK